MRAREEEAMELNEVSERAVRALERLAVGLKTSGDAEPTEVLEAAVKLSTRPTALIRMAPVWLSSFALPLLFRSMFFPPREYANIADAVREAASGGGLGEKRGGGKKRR